jgi:hypothetical protein
MIHKKKKETNRVTHKSLLVKKKHAVNYRIIAPLGEIPKVKQGTALVLNDSENVGSVHRGEEGGEETSYTLFFSIYECLTCGLRLVGTFCINYFAFICVQRDKQG